MVDYRNRNGAWEMSADGGSSWSTCIGPLVPISVEHGSGNVPKHYDLGDGKDIHDIERAIWGDDAHAKHLMMAAFEYIARAHKKGSNVEDIRKAIDCLTKAKRILEGEPLAKGDK